MDVPDIDPALMKRISELQDTVWQDLPAVQAAAADITARVADLPAIQAAVADFAARLATMPAIQQLTQIQATMLASVAQAGAQIQAVMESVQIGWAAYVENLAAKIDWSALSRLTTTLQEQLPANLRGIGDLESVAAVAHEGIALAWVPRTDIVSELLAADDAESRLQVLLARSDMILDDCDEILRSCPGEIAAQALVAVQTLRAGHAPAAQSHAANIVDSLVLILADYHPTARRIAVAIGSEDLDNLAWSAVGEYLALRPVVKAMVRFRAEQGDDIPPHFSRHATAHAVGQGNVFSDTHALVAVMLATSLTVHLSMHA